MWSNPTNKLLVPSADSNAHVELKSGQTTLPLPGHVGSFGFQRKYHIHEGVDLYLDDKEWVFAVEDGEVVALQHFTGTLANPPSPWWNDTMAVLVEGQSGVVVYGEVTVAGLEVGDRVLRNSPIGRVAQVLKVDKGRPMSMLHLELHLPGTRDTYEWLPGQSRPKSLLDPTMFLIDCKY